MKNEDVESAGIEAIEQPWENCIELMRRLY